MDAERGGWVVEITTHLPYNWVAGTASGTREIPQVFAMFIPFADEQSAERGMSEVSVSVRFLPEKVVKGEVIETDGAVEDSDRKAIGPAWTGYARDEDQP